MLLLIIRSLQFHMHSLRSIFHCFGFQVKVGCCTVDVIKQLSGEMISRNPTDGSSRDRMTTIANHILSQRRHVVVIHLVGKFSLDPSRFKKLKVFYLFIFVLHFLETVSILYIHWRKAFLWISHLLQKLLRSLLFLMFSSSHQIWLLL